MENVTLVVSGLGYEGEFISFEIEANDLDEAYAKVYAKANHYDEDEIEKLRSKFNEEEYGDCEANYWENELECMDSADFVLGSIYWVERKEFIYKL